MGEPTQVEGGSSGSPTRAPHAGPEHARQTKRNRPGHRSPKTKLASPGAAGGGASSASSASFASGDESAGVLGGGSMSASTQGSLFSGSNAGGVRALSCKLAANRLSGRQPISLSITLHHLVEKGYPNMGGVNHLHHPVDARVCLYASCPGGAGPGGGVKDCMPRITLFIQMQLMQPVKKKEAAG